jgi:hypothetical protein
MVEAISIQIPALDLPDVEVVLIMQIKNLFLKINYLLGSPSFLA